MPAVDSSMIHWIEHREAVRELDVTFASGKTYTYFGVPRRVYRAFLVADSKGSFFLDEIKNVYQYAQRSGHFRFG